MHKGFDYFFLCDYKPFYNDLEIYKVLVHVSFSRYQSFSILPNFVWFPKLSQNIFCNIIVN